MYSSSKTNEANAVVKKSEGSRIKQAREAQTAGVPYLSEEDVAQAEQCVGRVAKIRSIALKVTARSDWQDLGGVPYLNHSGCMKVAALFGVSLTGTEVTQSRDKLGDKEVFRYVARTTAGFHGRRVDAEGVASSDDPFFSRKKGRTLPLSEIDLNSVRKKAVTNAQCRAVKMILGLGSISWDDVRGAGVERGDLAQVNYGSSDRRFRTPLPQKKEQREVASQASAAQRRSANVAPRQTPEANESSPHEVLEKRIADLAEFAGDPLPRVLRRYSIFQTADGEQRYASTVSAMSDRWVRTTLERLDADWRSIPRPAAANGKEVVR